jgi:hypothetical protein
LVGVAAADTPGSISSDAEPSKPADQGVVRNAHSDAAESSKISAQPRANSAVFFADSATRNVSSRSKAASFGGGPPAASLVSDAALVAWLGSLAVREPSGGGQDEPLAIAGGTEQPIDALPIDAAFELLGLSVA